VCVRNDGELRNSVADVGDVRGDDSFFVVGTS
jgi:hypothetical protein